ncbi:ribose-5-phosphate isomerase RpiA [soil metagenome]
MSDVTRSADELKKSAAIRSADWVQSGMRVGLGTGSTIRFLLEELGSRLKDGRLREIRGVPTSEDTRRRAAAQGIPLIGLEDAGELDVTIDGADEVDTELRLIKGLGGALLREKIVAAASLKLVIVVDGSKIVDRLGSRSPLPVEVEEFGASVHQTFLQALGCTPNLRRDQSGAAFRTDGGNLIYDCSFPNGIVNPEALEREMNSRPGILESGLFLGMTSHVVVARGEGIEIIHRRED